MQSSVGIPQLWLEVPWKLGFVTDISRSKSDGAVVIKKSSSVVKIVILDRGGGCESALRLLEEKFRVLGDTCKGHGADLLIEDLARPFKLHIKQCLTDKAGNWKWCSFDVNPKLEGWIPAQYIDLCPW